MEVLTLSDRSVLGSHPRIVAFFHARCTRPSCAGAGGRAGGQWSALHLMLWTAAAAATLVFCLGRAREGKRKPWCNCASFPRSVAAVKFMILSCWRWATLDGFSQEHSGLWLSPRGDTKRNTLYLSSQWSLDLEPGCCGDHLPRDA